MKLDHRLNYSSLNVLSSAISLITINDIANNIGMRRFFKGLSKERPLRPIYHHTWDPKSVLDYFSRALPNENLNFTELSYKLVTLLALVTGQRIHTLSLIKIHNIITSATSEKIFIPDRTKI